VACFYIVDNSLTTIGGHHYEYIQCLVDAAVEFGFRCMIGTHRTFDPASIVQVEGGIANNATGLRIASDQREKNDENRTQADPSVSWYPVFRNTTYQRDSLLPGLASLKDKTRPDKGTENGDSILARWNKAMQVRRSRQLIRSFAYDCERFFSNQQFNTEDHVLLTTVSELELLGLAAYLSNHPRTLQVNWHLQFHFDLLTGRPAEYDKQRPNLDSIRDAFKAALSRIPYHQVNFFVTSQQLADQYNRLGVGEFVPLVYPVDKAFAKNATLKSSAHSGSTNPVKITVAGGVRREKGQREQLQVVVDRMWEEYFAPGKIQLFVQRKPGNYIKGPKFKLNVPFGPPRPEHDQPIVYRTHPCSKDEYVEFIKSSDIGLLCYDSRTYFARRAGILCEYLAAGIPVVVPAGCWLAEQIAPLHYAFVNELAGKYQVENSISRNFDGDSKTNVPLQGGVWSFDRNRHPFQLSCSINEKLTAVGFQFNWHWPRKTGAYCDLQVTQYNAAQTPIAVSTQTMGFSEANLPVGAVFNLAEQTKSFSLKISNAYSDETASICNVKIMGLRHNDSNPLPIGSVGAIASEQTGFVPAIEEVLRNLSHYRQSAERFSLHWSRAHLPHRTIARLIAAERTSINVA
jgi:hypothetical protein